MSEKELETIPDDQKIANAIEVGLNRAELELVKIGTDIARMNLNEFNFGAVHGYLRERFEKRLPNLMNGILSHFIHGMADDANAMLAQQVNFLKAVGAARGDIAGIEKEVKTTPR